MPQQRKAAEPSSNGVTTEFELEKMPKGAGGVRFKETPPKGQEEIIGSVYVRQDAWVNEFDKAEVLEATFKAAS